MMREKVEKAKEKMKRAKTYKKYGGDGGKKFGQDPNSFFKGTNLASVKGYGKWLTIVANLWWILFQWNISGFEIIFLLENKDSS